MIVLKANIDDSSSDKNAPYYVLGGWIAPVETWDRFSSGWASTLSDIPAIDWYKTNDAIGLKNQFSNWVPEARDRKVMATDSGAGSIDGNILKGTRLRNRLRIKLGPGRLLCPIVYPRGADREAAVPIFAKEQTGPSWGLLVSKNPSAGVALDGHCGY